MRIVHFSDWHGTAKQLPESDLYVCTGDMAPNFPVRERDYGLGLFRIDRRVEEESQTRWMADPANQMRQHLGSPDVPVICVRGNHDFVPIEPMFAGCDVRELIGNEVYEVLGERFTGHRGIPYINGVWNDETHRPDLIERMKDMPSADVYVTHYPPWGILDYDGPPGREEHYGLEEMAYRLVMHTPPTVLSVRIDLGLPQYDGLQALHLFGHVHECGGRREQYGGVLFSNAATTFNVIDF